MAQSLIVQSLQGAAKPAIALVLGFTAGLLAAIVLPLTYKRVVLYPTPANAKSMVYQDKAGVCFTPNVSEVACSQEARSVPAQS